MTLTDLLAEADEEEEQGIRWKKRKLRKRLIEYRNYLYANYKENTVNSYFSTVLSVYRHLEFELQPLPKFSTKNLYKDKPIEYSDLPNSEIIKAALLHTNNMCMKSIILFISSSGTSRADCLNLTIKDYIEATREYHKLGTNNIYYVIQKLQELEEKEELIVPRFNIQRQKTGVYYFTFCSPECVSMINNYLLSRHALDEDDKLFKVDPRYLTDLFIRVNDELGLGYVGTYRRFRTHMLRKFHASNLKIGEDGLSEEIVNELQGRAKPGVNQSYFFDMVEDIKEKYIKAMPNILIGWKVEIIQLESEDYKLIKEENEKLKSDFDQFMQESKQEIESMKKGILAQLSDAGIDLDYEY